MNELALFAGAGGGILAGKMLGWRTVCAVEWEAYPASVLAARQNDGHLEPFPIWDDVRTFDGTRWAGRVDIVSGGFPCQDISSAGRGEGIEGERSGMWVEMARIISEVRPFLVWVENSAMLTSRGLGRVLGDLAEMGFDAEWGVLGACEVGAPHKRERIWIVAYSSENRRVCSGVVQDVDRAQGTRRIEAVRRENRQRLEVFQEDGTIPVKWLSEPSTDGMADGVADHVGRLAATGNGQVPDCAAYAFNALMDRIQKQ